MPIIKKNNLKKYKEIVLMPKKKLKYHDTHTYMYEYIYACVTI